MTDRAIFLDRDGTIMVDTGYVGKPEQVQLLPGAGAALAEMMGLGYRLALITNQSGVGRGYFDSAAVEAVNRRLFELLDPWSVRFDAIRICPHHPDVGCSCRKPAPAMILQAAGALGVACARSYMIGDKESDVQAGRAAGCRTVLIGRDAASVADLQVDGLPAFVRRLREGRA